MIELSEFTKEQRATMLRNMEHTDFITYRKANWLIPTHTNLSNQYGKEYTNELWMLLTFSARCVRYGTGGFRLSLNANHYSKAKTITKKSISCAKTKVLLEMMEDDGYLVLLKGFYHNETEYARSSVLINSKLTAMLDKNKAVKFALSREESMSIIEVIDSKLTKVTKTRNKNGSIIKHKKIVFKETKGKAFAGLKEKRKALHKLNTLISQSKIEIDNKEVNSIIYKQRFEDNLQTFGRFYDCGTFQTSKSELRETIKINNNPTCEIDYKNIQPRILATEAGVTFADGFDPYSVGITIDGKTAKETRKIIKGMFFPILFTDKRADAKRAITNNITELKLQDQLNSEMIVKAIETHNHEIAHLFYNKSNSGRLQNIDSQMAEYIINHFTNKGAVCLCWHDSFVVEAKYQDELEQMMFEAWNHILGNTNNCGVDLEYNNTEKNEEKDEKNLDNIEKGTTLNNVEFEESEFRIKQARTSLEFTQMFLNKHTI